MMLTLTVGLLALYLGFAIGVGFGRAFERDRAAKPRRARLVVSAVPARTVRVLARVASPEMAGWN